MGRRFWPVAVGITVALAAAVVAAHRWNSPPQKLALEVNPNRLPADGLSSATLAARPAAGVRFEIVEGHRHGRLENARLCAGVLPGRIVVEARTPGLAPARAALETALVTSDLARDGTPDFLRLSDEADQRAFVRWFTFLAESQYLVAPKDLRKEIDDCAALVRFAYREALREHDGRWASELKLPAVLAVPQVRKYQYPFTPLGARLFRVTAGPFTPADFSGAAFAEFADAETLLRRNCHFVSRDLRRATPGDLLFFRQLEQDLPFHVMVFLGPSQFDGSTASRIIYHTGPLGNSLGEIRRPSVEELLNHPSPRWKPSAGNSNFLGVYRWNILRDMV